MPSVGAHREIRADLERAVRRLRGHAEHAPAVADEVDDLRFHLEVEGRVGAPLFGEEVEEVPLRHQDEEAASRGQPGEVRDHDALLPDVAPELADLLVRPPKEALQPAQLGDNLESGRVDSVAAEVAEEVRVLFEHDHVDARAREQEAERHARGSAAGDAASRLDEHCFPL